MKIKFDLLTVEGFRSIVEPLTFNLHRPGLNMVKGHNGAGKTTLFEALIWVLYGANLKGTVSAKVQSWKEVRTPDYKGTHVGVSFTVDSDVYGIERTIKYDKMGDALIVKKNGVQIPELNKDDTQAYIDSLLTMDYKTFMNSFMFGQRMTRLVESSSADKRKLFEELFDMNWIASMREKVVLDEKEAVQKVADQNQKISLGCIGRDNHHDKVEELNGRVSDEMLVAKNRAQVIVDELEEYVAIKADYGIELTQLSGKLAALPPIVETVDYTDEIVMLEGKLNKREATLDSLRSERDSLIGKIAVKQEQLDNFDTSNFDAYNKTVIHIGQQQAAVVAELYDGEATAPLTDEEAMAIIGDYNKCLADHQGALGKVDAHRLNLRNMDGNTVCDACGRPFDNAEELKKHQREEQDKLVEADIDLKAKKMKLDSARVDANLVQKYQNLTDQRNNPIVPTDPSVAKGNLAGDINILTAELEKAELAIVDIARGIEIFNKELELVEDKQEECKDAILANAETERQTKTINDNQESYRRSIEHIYEDIQKLHNENVMVRVDAEKERLVDAKAKLQVSVAAIIDLQAELTSLESNLQVLRYWLKDIFAANGVKAYIFKPMLDELNQYTTKYGDKLGCSIRFSLDLTKVSAPFSTICSLGNKVNKDYKEYSGGEKQRLDIVLMFAMHDLMSSNTELNILIMDEVFEGLDEGGESAVFELIREKAETKSVFVISHSQVLDTLHSKTIDLSNDGKTEIL